MNNKRMVEFIKPYSWYNAGDRVPFVRETEDTIYYEGGMFRICPLVKSKYTDIFRVVEIEE